jgi:glycosyltransferase involved in cell wall biosynthesis
MRILHLTDHYPPVIGGIETHVAALAHRQALCVDQVTVLTSTPPSADGRTSEDTGPVHVVRAASLVEGWRLDVGRFDLVHVHVSVVAPFSAPLAGVFARRGVPTVVTVHSMWGGLGPLPMWAAAVSGLRGAPVAWTAVSTIAAQHLQERLPPDTRVRILPNAVDVPPREATPEPGGDVRLVSTMRVAGRKRPDELLRVFNELQLRATAPITLTVVGDGPLRPRVERLARRLGLADRVTVTGRMEPTEVQTLLAASDVYVAPAVLESFGLAALEARCVGLPVVGRQGTGLAEFVAPGVEGLLCRSDDALVDALDALVHDDELRRQISEHNRTVGSTKTWSHALAAHDDLYDLVGRRSGEEVLRR